ncbi:hypothetical protein ACLVWU_10615 [Bdellovibrio sp. HCB290]|uniref:hypothetical protein n=1 Tax=Bdellovibrio sp. HCB290 TaxID=3394356 RepID=UPI0039B6466B
MKKISAIFICVIVLGGLRFCYYGSLTRSCIYTENEVPLTAEILSSKVRFIKQAAILRGTEPGYNCLEQMAKIPNQIVQAESARYYPNIKSDLVGADSTLELTPIKLIDVTKHGITTMDSGPGPIRHLILQDQAGVFYQVATVSLGINSGDEYLQAIGPSGAVILSPDTKLTEK